LARKLLVEVVGDTSSLEKAFGRTSRSGSRLGGTFGSLAKAGALAAAGGIAAVGVGLTKVIAKAEEAQVSQAKMENQLKALGLNYQANAGHIDEVIQSTSKLAGLDDEDLQDAFTRLVRSTGDISKGLRDTALAADVARGANISLEAATKAISNAELGRVTGLRRLGVEIAPITAAQDALRASHEKVTAAQLASAKATDAAATREAALAAAQSKFAGAAQTYGDTAAGAQDRFRVALENLEETLGSIVLPTVTRWTTKVTDGVMWVDRLVAAFRKLNPVLAANSDSNVTAANSTAHTGATMDSATKAAIQLQSAVQALGHTWDAARGTALAVVKGIDAVIAAMRRMDAQSKEIIMTWGAWGKAAGLAVARVAVAIGDAAADAYHAAVGIGKAVVKGIIDGLGNMAATVGEHIKSGLSGAAHWAGGKLRGSGEYHWTKHAIGEPMGLGVIEGWRVGIAPLGGIISDNLSSLMVGARAKSVAAAKAWARDVAAGAMTTLLQDATAFGNRAAQEAADAQTISDYQAAIIAGNAGINHSGSPGDRDFAAGTPGFANGGVVGGPIGMPQLVVAHGGETITPPGMGAGMVVNVYVAGSVTTARKLVDDVVDGINRKTYGQGAVFRPGAVAT
jgi:hypothetical protein